MGFLAVTRDPFIHSLKRLECRNHGEEYCRNCGEE